MAKPAQLLVIAAVVAGHSPAAVAGPDGTLEPLEAAVRQGNSDAIARIGLELGASGLAPKLTAGRRLLRLGAVLASPSADDSWRLLEPLAIVATDPDRALSAPASHAAVLIALSLTPEFLSSREIATVEVVSLRDQWLAIAGNAGRWSDVRVHGLEAAVILTRLLPESAALPIAQLLRDPDPEIRRATLELMPWPLVDSDAKLVAERARGDDSDVVAVVALQALCRPRVADDGDGSGAATVDPGPILQTLTDSGVARLRRVVLDESLPPLPRVEAASCLAAADDEESRAVLTSLPKALPTDLRDMARALLRPPQ